VASHLCPDCTESPPAYIRHRSACRYRGIAKEIILLYKYKRLRALGPELARFLHLGLKEDAGLWWSADAMIPVPLHPRRQRDRGFNQAEVLARELSLLTEIPVITGQLKKRRDALPQTSLTGGSRRENLHEAFGIKDPHAVAGRVVVLVDDVFTTGSTLQECSRTLLDAGAREVRAVTIAQA
jgi:ComF family protein